MLGFARDHRFPVEQGGWMREPGFLTLTDRQDVVVIEQETGVARVDIETDQPSEQLGFLPQFIDEDQGALAMIQHLGQTGMRLPGQEREGTVRAQHQQQGDGERGGEMTEFHAREPP